MPGVSGPPVATIEALATALGSDLLAPKLQGIEGLDLLEKRLLTPPVTGNAGENGEATSIVAQYQPPEGNDGHFVSFDVEAARRQTTLFIKTLADTGHATVVP